MIALVKRFPLYIFSCHGCIHKTSQFISIRMYIAILKCMQNWFSSFLLCYKVQYNLSTSKFIDFSSIFNLNSKLFSYCISNYFFSKLLYLEFTKLCRQVFSDPRNECYYFQIKTYKAIICMTAQSECKTRD